jgi:drug/metabolite transporter (DMT)-like permease
MRDSANPKAWSNAFSPVLLAIIGVFLLTAMDAVVKGQMQSHPVVVAVFLRFAMGGLVSLAVLAWLKPPKPTASEVKANLLRVPLVVLTAGSFFLAISLLPLAEAISLAFLSPCFIAILGVIWLKERLDRAIIVALLGGLAGMVVMLWPMLQSGFSGSLLGVAAVLFSDFTYALNIILLRKLALKQHPATIVAFQNIGPALVLAPFAIWQWSSPSFSDLAMFLCAGTLGVAGHLLLTHAFSRANASRLAPTEFTSLIWAAFIGFVFFAEVPTLYTWAGAALIVAGSMLLARKQT